MRSARVFRFPLQPRIRRRALVATLQESAQPSPLAELAEHAFVVAALAAVALVGVALVPHVFGMIDGMPDAVSALSAGTLTP